MSTLLAHLTALVRLSRPYRVADGEGGQREEGVVLLRPAEAWAHIAPIDARDALLDGRQERSVTHRIRLRYHPEVSMGTRIAWHGRTFEVVSVINPDEARRELVCLCRERR